MTWSAMIGERRLISSRRAMMILASSRNLPLAGIDALALLLYRLDHLPSRN